MDERTVEIIQLQERARIAQILEFGEADGRSIAARIVALQTPASVESAIRIIETCATDADVIRTRADAVGRDRIKIVGGS